MLGCLSSEKSRIAQAICFSESSILSSIWKKLLDCMYVFVIIQLRILSAHSNYTARTSEIKNCRLVTCANIVLADILTESDKLTDTLVSGQLYSRPPCQNPVLLSYHTNSVFSHSRKRPAPVTDTLFAARECPLTRASTVKTIPRFPRSLA